MEEIQATLTYNMRFDRGRDPFSGETSMSTYPQTPSSEASIFRFLDIDQANKVFYRSQQLASIKNGNHVVVPKILHLQEDKTIHLLTEPVTNIREWFRNRYDEWNQNFVDASNNSDEERIGKRKKEWWSFIKLKFCVIFRDIVKAVQFLTSQRFSIFSLRDDVFITTMGRAKLFPRVLTNDHISEFHSLIVELIGSPFNSVVLGDNDFFIAEELQEFLQILDRYNLTYMQEEFLFNCCPYFWTDEEKINLIVKLNDLRQNIHFGIVIDGVVTNEVQNRWTTDIPASGIFRDVYEYAKKKNCPYAHGHLIRFARNVITHYTSYVKNALLNNKVIIAQQLSSVFPYLFRIAAICVLQRAKEMTSTRSTIRIQSSKEEILKSLLIDM